MKINEEKTKKKVKEEVCTMKNIKRLYCTDIHPVNKPFWCELFVSKKDKYFVTSQYNTTDSEIRYKTISKKTAMKILKLKEDEIYEKIMNYFY